MTSYNIIYDKKLWRGQAIWLTALADNDPSFGFSFEEARAEIIKFWQNQIADWEEIEEKCIPERLLLNSQKIS